MTIVTNKTSDAESSLSIYLESISRFDLLTFEQELKYSRCIEKGDKDALSALINANLRLVVRISKSYTTNEMGLMDLIQEGNLGLMKAAEKYDHRKMVRFSTYASWWIKQSITRSLSNKRRTIRLPHRKEESLKRLQQIAEEFSQQHTRQPSIKELASCSDMHESEVHGILDIAKMVVSLDSGHNQMTGSLLDFIEDTSYLPDEELMRKNVKEDTRRLLENLRERERDILVSRFAFDGGERQTLKAIAREMGISPETVRQIEIRALKKLRSETESIRDYVMAG